MTNTQPTANPESCVATTLHSGPADCLEGDCDELVTEDGEPTGVTWCSHVTTQEACGTHSEFTTDEWEYCTKAVPWPHLTATTPSTEES
ncbi:hypothetical protein OHV05_24625 [Kitasatospora sp. NBC_00070]|uniref:hypothetical protein n=1 Tax=Kitasatospora sp. NBC_00070 TaxID=2975962 RepID=UPI003244DCB0